MGRKNESRINAVEIQCLRNTCGVYLKDKRRNSDVRERYGLKKGVVTRVKKAILQWNCKNIVAVQERSNLHTARTCAAISRVIFAAIDSISARALFVVEERRSLRTNAN
ncbi:hypothetical protein EVAR_14100_1 [Eumeta japonica]|uniref:Uncharacterized protein n=1 Tax=Eumeta variegata TaxID=151549 RepID=A0A4C1UNJ9_EUMVA|nr:hypothetical protein EVAR_14100_1 [Eumeta japonica]